MDSGGCKESDEQLPFLSYSAELRRLYVLDFQKLQRSPQKSLFISLIQIHHFSKTTTGTTNTQHGAGITTPLIIPILPIGATLTIAISQILGGVEATCKNPTTFRILSKFQNFFRNDWGAPSYPSYNRRTYPITHYSVYTSDLYTRPYRSYYPKNLPDYTFNYSYYPNKYRPLSYTTAWV